MWKTYNYKKTELTDKELIDFIQHSNNRIIIIEAPTGYGKTTLINNLSNKTVKQFNDIYLIIFEGNNRIKTIPDVVDMINKSFDSEIFCLEDIDIDLQYKHATQKYVADILKEIVLKNTIVLTGIDIKTKCKMLLHHLQDNVDHFYKMNEGDVYYD